MTRDSLRRMGRSRRVADNRARDDREYEKASKLISYYLEVQRAAQVDTHAERRDVKQARPARVGSAVRGANAPDLGTYSGGMK
jgi:hypothetical protein